MALHEATGGAGPTGSGGLIPFASGIPVALTTIVGGLVGTTGLIGFGGSTAGVSLLGVNIDVTILLFDYSFRNTVAITLVTTTITITAQVYIAPADSTAFSPPAAVLNLSPPLAGVIAIRNY